MGFKILPYTIQNLLKCLAGVSELTTTKTIQAKRHLKYLETYFRELGAKSILVEVDYIDKDYLQDYAAYYDRCFQDYSRRTHRLHFFSTKISKKEFQKNLLLPPKSEFETHLQENYLGFVVVKPLPATVIGRTCLKTYGPDDGRRYFPSLRAYTVNLFGIQLEVTSLAYQEQDTVVAACATSALWTCFQGTGKLFQHHIPAPVEITRWAGVQLPENLLSAGARAFPNNGLTATQMAQAIRGVSLEPYVVRAGTAYNLNSLIYAYLRGKIPPILSLQISRYEDFVEHSIGAHAVAVTGYSVTEKKIQADGHLDFNLRSDRINKIYVHDDQVGPFSRMEWSKFPTPLQVGDEFIETSLKSSWSDDTYAAPDFLLLPLYEKIRIPFSLIHDSMAALNTVLNFLADNDTSATLEPEWDIFLTTVGDYKTSIREEYANTGIDYSQCLHINLPRFLWRVILRSKNEVHLDMLFDATGIAQHNLLVHLFSTGKEYYQILLKALSPELNHIIGLLPLQAKSVIAAVRS